MRLRYHKYLKQKGLTLIEVLIASVILFMAIGLAASVFQQNLLLQRKVLDKLEQAQFQQIMTRRIFFQLDQGTFSGQEESQGIKASWLAKNEKSSSFVENYNSDTDLSYSGRGKVTVYLITLTSDNWPDWTVEYKESLWSK